MDIKNQQKQLTPRPQDIVAEGKQQDIALATVLALLFGPFGLLYASVGGGFLMIIIEIIIAIVAFIYGSATIVLYALGAAQLVCLLLAVYATLNKYSAIEKRISFRNSDSLFYKTCIVFWHL